MKSPNKIDPTIPFAAGAAVSLRVQSVLFRNAPEHVERALVNLARAVDIGVASGNFSSVEIAYGDCSPIAVLNDDMLKVWRQNNPELSRISYTYFDANLGSARGHNRLLQDAHGDFVLILNPDVCLAPTALVELVRPFREAGVGETEARQLPIEHPKDYDPHTGETGWATTACAMIPVCLLTSLSGFDAETFFLYCDDVDFSWRLRLAGFKVIFQPSAVAFHDKRLNDDGSWMAGAAELYYSAEAALLMAHKWSRPDLVEKYLGWFEASDTDHLQRAAAEYRRRQVSGRLPAPLDPDGRVAEFTPDHKYTKHRFDM